MGSTAGRKPHELSAGAKHCLLAHGFDLVREASMADGPAVYAHRLAPRMLLSVSMSPRTATFVQWQFRGVPEHLQVAIPRPIQSGDVDAFDRAIAAAAMMVSALYSLGPRVADRIEDTPGS